MTKKKLILINPFNRRTREKLFDMSTISPPLGLGVIAALTPEATCISCVSLRLLAAACSPTLALGCLRIRSDSLGVMLSRHLQIVLIGNTGGVAKPRRDDVQGELVG